MSLFLLTFFIVYGGIHIYAFLKVKAALAFGLAAGAPFALFMLLMVLAPIITHYLERAGFGLFARITAHVGFIWGGLLFLFFSASIVLDLYLILIRLTAHVLQRDLSSLALSVQTVFYAPLILSLGIFLYGLHEANQIRVEHLTVVSRKIPPENSPLKIVQISDVHLGLIVRENRLNRILDKVKAEHPDILVSTGDLVDGRLCNLGSLEKLFKEVAPKYGKFAITGNHEFYAGMDNTRCFTENAGFTLLRGHTATAGGITIAGVDDPAGRFFGAGNISEKDLLSPLSRDRFVLFLKHRPLVDKDAIGLFDLQLSGHIHKGQIFPFTLLTALYYPMTSGKLDLPNGSAMYISRGSGTWGPPIRFLAPPEVTVIELARDSKYDSFKRRPYEKSFSKRSKGILRRMFSCSQEVYREDEWR